MLVLSCNISYVCDTYNISYEMLFKDPEANF